MKLDNIRVAQNGFVLEDAYGNIHVAKTLVEAAQIAGETAPPEDKVVYASGENRSALDKARVSAKAGQKIEAIKYLRNAFTPRLGLLEAKDLLEAFME